MTSRCNVCPAEIIWCVTVNEKPMPIDAAPHPDGNVKVTPRDGGLAPRAEVLGPLEREMEPAGTLHMPHHATCPNWSKRR